MQKYIWETPEEITMNVSEHMKRLRKRLKDYAVFRINFLRADS